MFNPLNKLFRYSDTVSFEVKGDFSQAVDRLARTASKPILQATFDESQKPSLVGTVSKDHVRIHKVKPMFGNLFKPIFLGKFQTDNHKTTLSGKFKMGLLPQITTYVFVLVGLIVQVFALPEIGSESGFRSLSFLEPSLFILGVISVVLFGKFFARRDVEWIKHQIETALS